ncbi:MAG TPA: hypothetical protein IGS53_18685 [Leptolyngbyaceae cyanobacterium M33_DOE_097]|uniref:Uncharacterized protein n=1 Tax=Oscillatoriales cyanobacterium SpSt-418 TaxID=2282169 RepID=A0A7C3PJH3_9CYAN|nr:hypothetical protein [Leptolyngbyaceae cyanobacterium M33_DOE_097]
MSTQDQELIPKSVLLRLLKDPFERLTDLQFWNGQLPPDFLMELPLPVDAKIIGTIVRYQGRSSEVILDAPQSQRQIHEFYANVLPASGWTLSEQEPPSPGFQTTTPGGFEYPTIYCHSEQQRSLTLEADQNGDDPTDIRLRLDLDFSACATRAEIAQSRTWNQEFYFPMPSLTLPENVQISQSRLERGGDKNNITLLSSAQINTTKSQEPLFCDYAEQLVNAGWSHQHKVTIEQSISSFWLIKDVQGNAWQGMFKLTQIEGQPNEYAASLLIWQ